MSTGTATGRRRAVPTGHPAPDAEGFLNDPQRPSETPKSKDSC
jgi:hypothetical protein